MKKIHLHFLGACTLASILFSGCFTSACRDSDFKFQSVALQDNGAWSLPVNQTMHPGAVQFINDTLGYSLGYNQSYDQFFQKTTDGGKSWITMGNFPGGEGFYFTNANIGYSTASGSILKTVDGGNHWSVVDSHGPGFQSIYFPDMNTGYALSGYRGVIIKTTNGGSSWTLLNTNVSTYSDYLNSIFFANADTGYALGDSGHGASPSRMMLKTTDGGNHWTKINLPLAYGVASTVYNLSSVYFTNANTGWIVGSVHRSSSIGSKVSGANLGGIIFKTTNGGTSWAVQDSGVPLDLYAVTFINATTGYAVGGGEAQATYSYYSSNEGCSIPIIPSYSEIFKTTDGGAHWIPEKIISLLSGDLFGPFGSVSCTASGFCAAASGDGIWIRK